MPLVTPALSPVLYPVNLDVCPLPLDGALRPASQGPLAVALRKGQHPGVTAGDTEGRWTVAWETSRLQVNVFVAFCRTFWPRSKAQVCWSNIN